MHKKSVNALTAVVSFALAWSRAHAALPDFSGPMNAAQKLTTVLQKNMPMGNYAGLQMLENMPNLQGAGIPNGLGGALPLPKMSLIQESLTSRIPLNPTSLRSVPFNNLDKLPFGDSENRFPKVLQGVTNGVTKLPQQFRIKEILSSSVPLGAGFKSLESLELDPIRKFASGELKQKLTSFPDSTIPIGTLKEKLLNLNSGAGFKSLENLELDSIRKFGSGHLKQKLTSFPESTIPIGTLKEKLSNLNPGAGLKSLEGLPFNAVRDLAGGELKQKLIPLPEATVGIDTITDNLLDLDPVKRIEDATSRISYVSDPGVTLGEVDEFFPVGSVNDWQYALPTDIDWRNYLDDDFQWEKYLPLDFNWKNYLTPGFPSIPDDAMDWHKFLQTGYNWSAIKNDMGTAWGGAMLELMKNKFPLFDFGGKAWMIENGTQWAEHLKEFFSFQKVLSADFDWRHYLAPGFDLRQYVKPTYAIQSFFPKNFDWYSQLPTNVDWRPYLSEKFDWRHFLQTDKSAVLPKGLEWASLIPKDLPAGFDWKPFLLSFLHSKDFLPLGFAWQKVVPIGSDWLQHWENFDWDEVADWLKSIPSEFQWQNYAEQIKTQFVAFFGSFQHIPHSFLQFVSQLNGIIDWSEYTKGHTNLKGGVSELKPHAIFAIFDTLKLNPLSYSGNAEELKMAYFKEMASAWFH